MLFWLFAVFPMSHVKHDSCRTSAEWAAWAQAEGMADIVEDPEDPGEMLYLFCMLSMNLSCFRQSLLLVVCQEIGSTELLFEAALLWSKKKQENERVRGK